MPNDYGYDFTEVADMHHMAQAIYEHQISIDPAFLARMEEMLTFRVEVASWHYSQSDVHDPALDVNNRGHDHFNQKVEEVLILFNLLPLTDSWLLFGILRTPQRFRSIDRGA